MKRRRAARRPSPRRNTLRRNGHRGIMLVRRYFKCGCSEPGWQSFPWNTPGVDLKCRGCGRYYEVRYSRCKSAFPTLPKTLPGGAYREYEHHKRQAREIDFLLVCESDDRVMVVLVRFPDQREGFVTPRTIGSGAREGYEVSDVHPACGKPSWFGVFPSPIRRTRKKAVASTAEPSVI